MNRAERSTATSELPATCAIAFKEWAGVCEALASGRQSIIGRKGGIEEGPGGFVPEHPIFWLYPTHVHQAEQGLKPEARDDSEAPDQPGVTIALKALAVVDLIGRVEHEDRLKTLDHLHVWTAETIEKRFQYRRPGLWVLGVRVFRRDRPALVPIRPEHAGCKTWVPLEDAPETLGMVPALDARTFADQMDRLRAALGMETNA